MGEDYSLSFSGGRKGKKKAANTSTQTMTDRVGGRKTIGRPSQMGRERNGLVFTDYCLLKEGKGRGTPGHSPLPM